MGQKGKTMTEGKQNTERTDIFRLFVQNIHSKSLIVFKRVTKL